MEQKSGSRTKNDLIGNKFGRLTVISFSHLDKRQAAYWLCQCSCGKERLVRRNSLTSGWTKSCGCLQKELVKKSAKKINDLRRKAPGEANFNILLSRYKRNAIKKGRDFSLSEELFRKLVKLNCYYCEDAPNTVERSRNTNGEFVYNGIDRIDNDLGYTESNTVTCCVDCNWIKGTMSSHMFIQKARQIASKHGEKAHEKK